MRFALIGCGDIGVMRADAVARLRGLGVSDARLVAAADADGARAQAIAARHAGCRALTDGDEAARLADADAVIVSTPPHLHARFALAAIAAGKSVLIEKPIASSIDDARAIVGAAAERGATLATGFNIRHFLAFRRAHELLTSGALGELDHVRAYHGHPGGSEFTHAWVHDQKVMGGGALLDNGIHILDLAHWFLGGVVEAKGYTSGHVWKFDGCEDNGFALFKNAAGRIATVRASWTEWRGYGFAVEVYGTRGMARASYPPMMLETAIAAKPGAPVRRSRDLFPVFQVKERVKSWRWNLVESLAAEMKDFADAARARRPPACSGVDGLRALEMAHAVYRSSQSGGGVAIPLA
ncbi:MAG: Gfo/Idh/MocA family protein [bacterium]